MNTTRLLAWWLLPVETARAEFAQQIENLARRYDAPTFAPHVTIHAATVEEEPDAETTRAVLSRATAGVRPITLRSTGIATSEKFTKTLFVTFADNDELSALSHRLQEIARSGYELHPHLSLLYAQLSADEKRRAAKAVELPFSDVEFDRVAAVTGAANTNSREDVQSWRVIAEVALL